MALEQSFGDACVEVGWHTGSDENGTAAERVLVRDTKDRTGPALTFSTPAWHAFLATLKPLITHPAGSVG